jgi:hypothetical protein
MANKFCTSCGKQIEDGSALCKSCGATVEATSSVLKSGSITKVPNIGVGVGGMQYKTIGAPIGLTVDAGMGYIDAVKKYAAIIDKEAVGGWELLLIQQIPLTKVTPNIGGILGFAALGAVIGFFISSTGVAVMIGLLGAVIGYWLCKNKVVELYNMLVFAKKN